MLFALQHPPLHEPLLPVGRIDQWGRVEASRVHAPLIFHILFFLNECSSNVKIHNRIATHPQGHCEDRKHDLEFSVEWRYSGVYGAVSRGCKFIVSF